MHHGALQYLHQHAMQADLKVASLTICADQKANKLLPRREWT
jgi:hypothetical protein